MKWNKKVNGKEEKKLKTEEIRRDEHKIEIKGKKRRWERRQDKTRHGKTTQDKTTQDRTRQDK